MIFLINTRSDILVIDVCRLNVEPIVKCLFWQYSKHRICIKQKKNVVHFFLKCQTYKNSFIFVQKKYINISMLRDCIGNFIIRIELYIFFLFFPLSTQHSISVMCFRDKPRRDQFTVLYTPMKNIIIYETEIAFF